ncbi:hypothetical protein D0X99_07185 [Algoriphagus lacus]|uniref:Uncharacterized protein n=1 Tax=Algoriphagus lacus TaxID=2056311 RepID=A0A418PT06_9BACT|nr:hypothetical protein D0X99_07185 [Algoriphagus lacus]
MFCFGKLVLIENPCKGKLGHLLFRVVNINFCNANFTFFNESLTPLLKQFFCFFRVEYSFFEATLKKKGEK